MRKIEEKLVKAIANRKPFHDGNTAFIKTGYNEWGLFLHGNKIAIFDSKSRDLETPTYVSLAGWPSKTTKSRLNCLKNVHVNTCKGIHYLNGKEIDSDGMFSPMNWNR